MASSQLTAVRYYIVFMALILLGMHLLLLINLPSIFHGLF
jgi:hypothetical protein